MLLPSLSLFEQYHALHENHAARVSSLFLRLDQAVYGLEVLDVLLIASAVKTAGNAPCSQSSSLVGLEQKLRQ